MVVSEEDITWHGPVTLPRSSTLTAPPGARFEISGTVDDASNPAANGSSLTLTGGGEFLLGGANTYRGTTFVNQGVLTLANSQALGGTGVAEIQSLTLSGATTGSFTLTFGGQSTAPLAFGAAARRRSRRP